GSPDLRRGGHAPCCRRTRRSCRPTRLRFPAPLAASWDRRARGGAHPGFRPAPARLSLLGSGQYGPAIPGWYASDTAPRTPVPTRAEAEVVVCPCTHRPHRRFLPFVHPHTSPVPAG